VARSVGLGSSVSYSGKNFVKRVEALFNAAAATRTARSSAGHRARCGSCKIFVSDQPAVIKPPLAFQVPAEVWLLALRHRARSAGRRTPPAGAQGAIGVGGNRINKAVVRPVECADAVFFAIAGRRLASNVDAKFTVSGGRPGVSTRTGPQARPRRAGADRLLGGNRSRRDPVQEPISLSNLTAPTGGPWRSPARARVILERL